MRRVRLFDIETNGLNPTKIHCVVIFDFDSGKLMSFGPDMVGQALELLRSADVLVGHNICGFDIPQIKRLTGVDLCDKKQIDTMAVSRAMFVSTLRESDFKRLSRGFPKSLVGRFSLESWGYRLGKHKGEFAKTTNWEEFTDEMLEYCEQDVLVNVELFKLLTTFERVPGQVAMPVEAMFLESRIHSILYEQEKRGIDFDETTAIGLVSKLQNEKEKLRRTLQQLYPPKYISRGQFTPKRDNARLGYASLCPLTKIELRDFNPGSDQQTGERLIEAGWKPCAFTPTGQPKVDETQLVSIKSDIPGVKELIRYKLLDKRLGQIYEGKGSWLNKVKDGKLHGRVQSTGARTGRMSASSPNLQTVPRVGSFLGAECRRLFGPGDKGWLVGCDASGLELRVLANRMKNKEFTEQVVDGDVHTMLKNAAGLHSRSHSKTFTYAKLYGASHAKLGQTVAQDLRDAGLPVTRSETSLGKMADESLMTKLHGFEDLVKAVKRAHKRGFLKLLNGLFIHSISPHSALNSLCQGDGSVVMKTAQFILNDRIKNKNAHFALTVHDEFQLVCDDEELAHEVGRIAVESIQDAGRILKMSVPLDGEYKVGHTWEDTH